MELLNSLLVSEEDPRYLNAQVSLEQVEISSDGLQAQVAAEVSWNADQPSPQIVWLVIIAYDAADRPVGVRKLETQPACLPESAASCTSLEVEGIVYSLGPAIQRVEALVEARP